MGNLWSTKESPSPSAEPASSYSPDDDDYDDDYTSSAEDNAETTELIMKFFVKYKMSFSDVLLSLNSGDFQTFKGKLTEDPDGDIDKNFISEKVDEIAVWTKSEGFALSDVDVQHLEDLYTDEVLKNWLAHAVSDCRNFFLDSSSTVDDLQEVLDELKAFEDIRVKSPLLKEWGKDWLKLLLDQHDLFKSHKKLGSFTLEFKKQVQVLLNVGCIQAGSSWKAYTRLLEALQGLLNSVNLHPRREQIIALKNVEPRDFYSLLGVRKDTPSDEFDASLKKAYRKLALKYHPDKNGHALKSRLKHADIRFKQINEANDCLKDPVKRMAYDQDKERGFRSERARENKEQTERDEAEAERKEKKKGDDDKAKESSGQRRSQHEEAPMPEEPPEPYNFGGIDDMQLVVASYLKNAEAFADEITSYAALKAEYDNLSDDDWLTSLYDFVQSAILENLSPITKVTALKKNGKKIVQAKGAVVQMSKVLDEALKKKRKTAAEDLHIIGLASVIIDEDLDVSDWHGTNILLVTDQLVVQRSVTWNVSGLSNLTELPRAEDGRHPGADGLAGEHGQPGESGGNVTINFRKGNGHEDLVVTSEGGVGSPGQDGGRGQDGIDGADAMPKMGKDDFQRKFPSTACALSVISSRKETINSNIRCFNERKEWHRKIYNGQYHYVGETYGGQEITISGFEGNIKGGFVALLKGQNGAPGSPGGRGGKGGEGGDGGFRGVIKINRENVQSGNDRAKSGRQGADGTGGKNGRQGLSTGDVGTLDWNFNNNDYFYGFNCNQRLSIEYHWKKPSRNECALCYPYPNGDDRWATIESQNSLSTTRECQTTRQEKTSKGRSKERKSEATKKKDFLEREVSEQEAEIDRRKTEIDTSSQDRRAKIQARFQQFEDLGEDVASIAADEKKEEQHQNVQIVRTMTKKKEVELQEGGEVIRSTKLGTRLACRKCQEYLKPAAAEPRAESKPQLSSEAMAESLYKAGTVDDINNIFHAIFGVKNCDGIFESVESVKYRETLAKFVMNDLTNSNDREAIIEILKEFVSSSTDKSKNTQAFNIKNDLFKFEKSKTKQWEEICAEAKEPENQSVRKWLNQEDCQLSTCDFNEDLKSCSPQFREKVKKFLSPYDWERRFKDRDLLNEYSKFILDETNTLGRPELGLVALAFRKKIHVFEDDDDGGLVHAVTLGQDSMDEHCVLIGPDGRCQRLHWETSLKEFHERRMFRATALKKLNEKSESFFLAGKYDEGRHFEALLNFVKEKGEDKLKAIKRIDPQFRVPDVFSKLLLEILQKEEDLISAENLSRLVEAITRACTLSDDELSIFSVWNLLANICPHVWDDELLIVEVEDCLRHVFDEEERAEVKRCLHIMPDELLEIFREKLEEMKSERFMELVKVLLTNLTLRENDLERLEDLSLADWIYELKAKYWEQKIEDMPNIHIGSKSKNEQLLLFVLELEAIHGQDYCEHFLKNLSLKELKSTLFFGGGRRSENSNSNSERTLKNILDIMSEQGQTSKLENVERLRNEIAGKSEFFKVADVFSWASAKMNSLKLPEEAAEFISVYNFAVSFKMGFRLRATQQLSILSVLTSGGNIMSQVSTGEGKSLIVAGIAIAETLSGHSVDVLTSSDLLAKRDSTETVRNGGLSDLYAMFGVTVGNNSSSDDEDLKQAYNCDVVYGEMSNFQRDHLLQTFYGRNLKGSRRLDRLIVDEVDCMLLDNGNNILFLSHNIPGMADLESLYVYIWEKVNLSGLSLEQIKADILYDLLGQISKDDLDGILPPDKRTLAVKNTIWTNLVRAGIIDGQGRLLITDQQKLTDSKFCFDGFSELKSKLNAFFTNVTQRHRTIKVPKHLEGLVVQHLDTWLTNSVHAQILMPDIHYVIDKDRSRSSSDFNSQVIIIDSNTGNDQSSSQWDESLHQFLQLKEGCQITPQSLKAVFVSNVSYIRMYDWFSGLSGTLGSQQEREHLLETYSADFQIIPTAFPKQFTLEPAKILDSEEKWMSAIAEEAKKTLARGRSMLTFFQSIQKVNQLREYFKEKNIVEESNLHCYTRDFEEFKFEADQLGQGHVILSTNLAGRGTDIKLSEGLVSVGGLHVCLTFLPDNVRIEEQAFGRAGRKGQPGSGILILLDPGTDGGKSNIFQLKRNRDVTEIKFVSDLKDNFKKKVALQERCFAKFSRIFKELKQEVQGLTEDEAVRDFVCKCAVDRWALILDSLESKGMKMLTEPQIMTHLDNELKTLKAKSSSVPELVRISSSSPARRVQLAKILATAKDPDFGRAKALLDSLIEEDEFWYPQAHYYRAMILINECEKSRDNMSPIIKELFTAEKFLDGHVQLQMTFASIVTKISESQKQASMFPRDFYKEQKENVIHLLEIFRGSIHQILGSNISTVDLAAVADLKPERAEEVFKTLASLGLIEFCRLAPISQVPGRHKSLLEIEADFGLQKESLGTILDRISFHNALEEDVDRELKRLQILKLTRKTFWTKLVEENALTESIDCLIISKANLPEELKNAETVKADADTIFFNPVALEDLKDKVIISKAVAKEMLACNYKEKKKSFDSNKIAKLDIEALRKCDLTCFGCFSEEDLIMEGISSSDDRKRLVAALVQQGIIDNTGRLADHKKSFENPECPLYEAAVQKAVERKFVAAGIQKRWLDPEEKNKNGVINALALKPYRSLLIDLIEAKLIAPPSVKVKANLNEDGGLAGLILNNFDAKRNAFTVEEERKKILSYLRNHQASYSNLETMKAYLNQIETRLDGSEQHKNIFTEVQSLALVGFDDVIDLEEKKWSFKMICRSIAVIAIGLAQVVLGAIVAIKSAGFMTHVSSGLISEGVSDILFAASALWSGNNFTWADYGKHKMESIIITAGSIGVGALLSRGVKFFKYGHKVAGNSLSQGGKKVTESVMKLTFKETSRQVAKTTAMTIGKAVGFHLLRQGIETLVQKYLSDFCRKVGTQILETFNNIGIYISDLKGTLKMLYRCHGKEKAKQMAAEKLQQIMSGGQGILQNCRILFNSIVGSVSTGIANALKKRSMAGAKELEAASVALEIVNFARKIYEQFDFLSKIKNLLTGHIGDFNSELRSCCQPKAASSQRDDDENVKKFQDEVVSNLKTTLGAEAGKLIEAWTAQMLNKAAVWAVNTVASEAKKVYKKRKENNEIKKLRQLQMKERQRKLNEPASEQEDSGQQGPSDVHVEECLKIMKKTKSAKVFAEIVREGVPMDRFCGQALEEVLQKVPGMENVRIQIDTTDGKFSHRTTEAGDGSHVIVLRLDRDSLHYMSDEETANGKQDCMLTAVAAQLREHGINLPDNETLRNEIANRIEQNPEIRNAIERGWHQFTLNERMFGGVPRGCGQHGVGGPYKEARRKSERGISDADHQPAVSMWQHAQDEEVRKLKKEDLPTMTIPSARHSETENYKGKARNFNDKTNTGMFNSLQKKYMKEGNYKEAIWHAMNVNWLNWMKESDRNTYVRGLDNYLDAWTRVKTSAGTTVQVITPDQAGELKSRVQMKFFRETIERRQANN